MRKERGFTLIELLVVIAIIGILSSVVLASLNGARVKGADAAVKSQLAAIPAQAETSYDTNGSYSSVCTDTTIARMLNSATTTGGAAGACVAGANAWVVSSPLKSSGFWCIGSAGGPKAVASNVTTSTDCI